MVLIETRGPTNKNPRLQETAAKHSRIWDAKKHKKTRFRDSLKTPPRFRDRSKNFRDAEFFGHHSPPLILTRDWPKTTKSSWHCSFQLNAAFSSLYKTFANKVVCIGILSLFCWHVTSAMVWARKPNAFQQIKVPNGKCGARNISIYFIVVLFYSTGQSSSSDALFYSIGLRSLYLDQGLRCFPLFVWDNYSNLDPF